MQLRVADLRLAAFCRRPTAWSYSDAGTVKVMSVEVVSSDTTWTIMSTLMIDSGSGLKMAAATPGLSVTSRKVICASARREGDARDDLLFHDLLLIADQRALPRMRRIVEDERTSSLTLFTIASSTERTCSTLAPSEAISSISSNGDLVEPPRLRHDARVGRIDAVDIGIDVAAVGRDRRRDATAEVSEPPRPSVVTRLVALCRP